MPRVRMPGLIAALAVSALALTPFVSGSQLGRDGRSTPTEAGYSIGYEIEGVV